MLNQWGHDVNRWLTSADAITFVCDCSGNKVEFQSTHYVRKDYDGMYYAWAPCPWYDALNRHHTNAEYDANQPQQHMALLDEWGISNAPTQ